MEEESIVLQPVIIKCFGLGNKHLEKMEVVSAPRYVVYHLFDNKIEIPAEEIGEIMVELMSSQHPFQVLEPRIDEICLLDYAASQGWDTGLNKDQT